MASDADRVLAAVAIENYIGRFVPLKRRGGNFWGLCPFHNEKTPSFSVSPQKGIYKCFGCGAGGNVITFAKNYHKISFPEALKLLADFAGIELHERQRRPSDDARQRELLELQQWVQNLYRAQFAGSAAEQYANARGITPHAAEHFGLGYAPDVPRFLESKLNERYRNEPQLLAKALEQLALLGLLGHRDGETFNRFRDRLTIPIRDVRGQVVAFGGRLLREKDNAAKYINSPDTPLFHKSQTVFHLGEALPAIRREGFVLVCEGYLDVLGLFQAGLGNAVAPLGTAFTLEQAKLIKRFTDNVTLFFDNDRAGSEAAFKALPVLRQAGLSARIIHPLAEGDKCDPFDLSVQLPPEELRYVVLQAKSELQFVLWYFFRFRYNTTELSQKKRALSEFYAFVRTLETELERSEFLRAAAELLQVEKEVLQRDFATEPQKLKPEPQPLRIAQAEKAPEQVKAGRQEKEIIALLLRFPELMAEELLLAEIPWQNESAYLLFSFFRDRLKSGEVFRWEDLKNAMQFLPDDLAALLAEIMLDYDPILATQSIELAQARVQLRKLVRTLAIRSLEQRIQSRAVEIARREKFGEDVEALLLEQQEDIHRRTQWFRMQ
ncbi:MAG: DNA primase [Turneriella sp.]|nr:DNA primase [Turneriella sp.]